MISGWRAWLTMADSDFVEALRQQDEGDHDCPLPTVMIDLCDPESDNSLLNTANKLSGNFSV